MDFSEKSEKRDFLEYTTARFGCQSLQKTWIQISMGNYFDIWQEQILGEKSGRGVGHFLRQKPLPKSFDLGDPGKILPDAFPRFPRMSAGARGSPAKGRNRQPLGAGKHAAELGWR